MTFLSNKLYVVTEEMHNSFVLSISKIEQSFDFFSQRGRFRPIQLFEPRNRFCIEVPVPRQECERSPVRLEFAYFYNFLLLRQCGIFSFSILLHSNLKRRDYNSLLFYIGCYVVVC